MISVTKASGEPELFSVDKVRLSLQRAGAKAGVIDKILLEIKPKLYDKISTKEVYHLVYELFDRYQRSGAYHYHLKPAIMDLGPSGYPFEKFIAKLFEQQGYQTQTRAIIPGRCVSHEIDVVAEKGDEKYLMECKFHQRPGTKSDVKDALYVRARFEDIEEKFPGKYRGIWLVTNTKLTTQAIAYGTCRQMKLLAWHYPAGNSLEILVEKYRLHPLTCLPFLSSADKERLMAYDLVLCRDLAEQTDKQLSDIGLNDKTIKLIRLSLN